MLPNRTRTATAELGWLKQKAKITWLREMDKNSKYFHTVVKEKQVLHTITRLQRADGSFAETNSQIADEIIHFYERLNGCTNSNLETIDPGVLARGPTLDELQQQELIKPVTNEEIKLALFSISELKAPGPDKYGSGFFKDAWEVVQHDIKLAVSDFFATGAN